MTSYEVDVSLETVQIHKEIDAVRREDIHATRVVGGFVDVIDSDSVCSQLLHQSSVTATLVDVHKRIIFDQLICDTCRMVQSCTTNFSSWGAHP